ncbi:MAG TPA: ATP-dependent DNA helicase RecG [Pirellulales bacterium]|jgi:ATP-dependent DNA helicase RecG|nr:ATP-dependent DNA helicase RecG [Pirellulales bacterium]
MSEAPADLLATPVQFLKGVGPQRVEAFHRLGQVTARDLLFHFPRDYHDLIDLHSLDDLEEGKLLRLRGTVLDVDCRRTRGRRSLVAALVRSGAGTLRALWFNQPFLREKVQVGQQVLLAGKPRFKEGSWQLVQPTVQWLDVEPEESTAKLLPVYPLTEGLKQFHVRRAVRAALELCVELLDEAFPPEYLAEHKLWPLRAAVPAIHFPADRAMLEHARRRFIYQELFMLQLALAIKHQQRRVLAAAPPLEATARIDARIRRLFPFELTAGQEQAIREVRADMARPHPMNRLLQGDVGSGKTAVAIDAVLLAVAHGYQAAIMAPTEILARQHAQTLGLLLSSSQVRWGCLVSGISSREREKMLADLRTGELDVVIGTQAILQHDVEFAKLALVVIDEQHKFGVRQRETLKRGSSGAHYLVMTATPIPRSIAMTMFGDLDVTTIRDAPPGRQPVHTYLAAAEQRERWWEFFRKHLRSGSQAYVIAPVVGSDDNEPPALDAPALASAEQMFEHLSHGPLEAFRLGLVHGRMSAAEKDAAMEAFRSGKTRVLVATTVVEVGVDVPNATLLTIEDGDRFGLAQLHQLRGRISRGNRPGYCCVFAEARTDDARERLDAFIRTTDGFELAEIDFRLRGPGDLLGTQQHGLPPLRIADLRRDLDILNEARADARQMVMVDPGLGQPAHQRLRKMMLTRYGRVLELGDVG